MKKWFFAVYNWGIDFAFSFFKTRIEKLVRDTEMRLSMQYDARAKGFRDDVMSQLASIQAIDVGFKEPGHIVVLARVQGRDYCKIFKFQGNMSMRECREMTGVIQDRFGARPAYADVPVGIDPAEFGTDSIETRRLKESRRRIDNARLTMLPNVKLSEDA